MKKFSFTLFVLFFSTISLYASYWDQFKEKPRPGRTFRSYETEITVGPSGIFPLGNFSDIAPIGPGGSMNIAYTGRNATIGLNAGFSSHGSSQKEENGITLKTDYFRMVPITAFLGFPLRVHGNFYIVPIIHGGASMDTLKYMQSTRQEITVQEVTETPLSSTVTSTNTEEKYTETEWMTKDQIHPIFMAGIEFRYNFTPNFFLVFSGHFGLLLEKKDNNKFYFARDYLGAGWRF